MQSYNTEDKPRKKNIIIAWQWEEKLKMKREFFFSLNSFLEESG